MLYEILKSIKNFFPTDKREEREFTIEDGTISLPFVLNGAYVLIEGSVLNDGVYQYPIAEDTLKDETFTGVITMLAIPPDFLKLANEIKDFDAKDTNKSAFTSESFGGYSYSRATNAGGGLADWHDVYRGKLNAWRKI